jgi:hypothetical protein
MEASGQPAGAFRNGGKELSHGRSSLIKDWSIKTDNRILIGFAS